MLLYQGKYYLFEAEATANSVKTNALKMLNKLISASMVGSTAVKPNIKDDLRLFGASLENMDLWGIVVEYFDTFAHLESTKTYLRQINDEQSQIIQLVIKMSEEFVIQYRNANNTHIRQGNKKTNNDFIYRYIRNTYMHYFYFVGLYNLRFAEYIQELVSSGKIFNKGFNTDLSSQYDPPLIQYYKNGYLPTTSKSDFNNTILNQVEWKDELDRKTETVTSGFSKSRSWNFVEFTKIFENGLKIKDSNPPIWVKFSTNSRLTPYINKIDDHIDVIVDAIKHNLDELSSNIIAKNSKNADKAATVVATNKEIIKKNVEPISKPYNTKDEYDSMERKFRGIDHEQNKKAVEDVSKFTKKGNIMKKRTGTFFNSKEK